MGLIMEQHMPFAFETVFSYLQKHEDGTYSSKEEIITTLQHAGYAVALLFVGLASAELSILRAATRRRQGGHDVPENKMRQRFPRTQEAIRLAAPVAGMIASFQTRDTPVVASWFCPVRSPIRGSSVLNAQITSLCRLHGAVDHATAGARRKQANPSLAKISPIGQR
jgi:hypothetical protein